MVAENHNGQAEAFISVAPNGRTILSCMHGLFVEPSPAYASLDGGKTFDRLALPPDALVGGDCDTEIMDDGTWLFISSTLVGATVLVTEDQGASWTVNPVAAIPINGLADRPWLEAVGDEIWLTYVASYAEPGTVAFTKSLDKGRSWTTPTLVGTPGPGRTNVMSGPAQSSPGSDLVSVPLLRFSPEWVAGVGEGVLQVAETRDGGATWHIVDLFQGAVWMSPPNLAVAKDGHRFMVFAASLPADGIYAIHAPAGGAWSEPMLVLEGSVGWPWVDGAGPGNATFAVDGPPSDAEGPRRIWIGQLGATADGLHVELAAVGNILFLEYMSVDHDASGQAHVVWVDGAAQWYLTHRW